ncbi:hypothetical protein GCK72_025689 [Caenorhabditis remanei]|uniref:Uncharacterized protein n=1 Tax=Caenorhabditis remanei TaxID=31234 RepID=A0A6A5G3E3_CAERE|nr:hypothetical protein GCK72_025689 [Caenorhabditis remanei]KAF1749222.1 hypothetical protein GCK72_025689 [Caenorhabditis remanei]
MPLPKSNFKRAFDRYDYGGVFEFGQAPFKPGRFMYDRDPYFEDPDARYFDPAQLKHEYLGFHKKREPMERPWYCRGLFNYIVRFSYECPDIYNGYY